jgi:hypothetical protein
MHKCLLAILGFGAIILAGIPTTGALANDPQASWDGLNLVKSWGRSVVYLQPEADFRTYTKVQILPAEVAFAKNWVRDYNSQVSMTSNRLSASDVNRITQMGRSDFQAVFVNAFVKAGYQVVTTPGPDVLQLRPSIIDVSITAPDTLSAGRIRSYSIDAGEATLVLEAFDSETGAILGRAVDRRTVGDSAYVQQRTSVSNRSDFRRVFALWAKRTVERLEELKSTPATKPAPQ